MRRGYDPAEVRGYLAGIADAIETEQQGGPGLDDAPTPDQIRHREFSVLRRGYDPDVIRPFLDMVADVVARVELGGDPFGRPSDG